MRWDQPGAATITPEGPLTVLTLSGNFHRDLPVEGRDCLRDQVRSARSAQQLLIRMPDLVRLDSWAEGVIADTVDAVIESGGDVGVLEDAGRPHHLTSLKVLLARHGARVRCGVDEADLRAWLESQRP